MKRPAGAPPDGGEDGDGERRRKARGSTSDIDEVAEQQLRDLIGEYILVPTDASYVTQKLDGKQDTDKLIQNKDLLIGMKKIAPRGISQDALYAVLLDHAEGHEDPWHLADAAATWAAERARHIRSMMRHVFNATRKTKPPQWAVDNFPKTDGDDDGSDNEPLQLPSAPKTPTGQPTHGACASPHSGAPAASAQQEAAAPPEAPVTAGSIITATDTKWRFEYDQELQAPHPEHIL